MLHTNWSCPVSYVLRQQSRQIVDDVTQPVLLVLTRDMRRDAARREDQRIPARIVVEDRFGRRSNTGYLLTVEHLPDRARLVTDGIPEMLRRQPEVRELTAYAARLPCMLRLLAPQIENENHTKDVDFSPSSLRECWEAGYQNRFQALEQAPWEGEFNPLEGVILHEIIVEMMEAAE